MQPQFSKTRPRMKVGYFFFLLLAFISTSALAGLTSQHKLVEKDSRLPRELGHFKLKHAGFVEVFENEADGLKSIYITTFNPALPFFHDHVYYIADAGNKLDNVRTVFFNSTTLRMLAISSIMFVQFTSILLHC